MEDANRSEPQNPGSGFDRTQQLSIVTISHFFICGVVFALLMLFEFEAWPDLFFIVELSVIGVCLLLLVLDKLVEPLTMMLESFERGNSLVEWLQSRVSNNPEFNDQIKGVGLLVVFAMQFVALLALLHDTGGPIDSPFAPMALAFAIYTPYLAQNKRTMWAVLGLSITYYAALVAFMEGTLSNQDEVKWAYFIVATMIVAIGVLITWVTREQLFRETSEG